MRLLVTGGCGFVGSNFIRYILQHYGPEMITNVDALTTGRLANVEGLAESYGDRYEFLHADVADMDKIDAVLVKHQFFAVIHFAAEAAGAVGTTALLEQARRHGVRRFLVVSKGRASEALSAAEEVALNAYRDHGEEVVITRAADTYGPYQPLTGSIPGMIVNALRDRPVRVGGDGSQTHDWLHVDDHCSGLFTALLDGIPGTTYHFASGYEWRDVDLAQRVLEQLGKRPGLIEVDGSDRPGDFGAARAATGRNGGETDRRNAALQPELSWKPRHLLETGLRETVDWYVRNREWWESQTAR